MGRALSWQLCALLLAGCGATIVDASGRSHDVSKHAERASIDLRRYELQLGVAERCGYWAQRMNGLDEELRPWGAANRSSACAAAEQALRQQSENAADKASGRPAPYKEDMDRVAKERAAEIRTKYTELELAQGKCSTQRSQTLQLIQQRVASSLEGMRRQTSRPILIELERSDIKVAALDAAHEEVQVSSGGEVHVIAASFEQVKLEVIDHNDNELSLASPYEFIAFDTGAMTDSRAFHVGSGQSFRFAAKGKGCTLVMLFFKD